MGSYVEGKRGRHFAADHVVSGRVCFFIKGNPDVGFDLEEVGRKSLMVPISKEVINM
jgi:hypothetical protein